MGLIQYNNIENDAPATANMFNERFGRIVDEMNGNLEGVNFKDGSIPLSKLAVDVLARIYPIGSVYINATSDANPNSLLGFGTWEAFGAGRVLVGKADTGTFASAGTEVGAETVALTSANNGAHSHTGTTSTTGAHTHSTTSQVAIKTGSTVGLTAAYNDAFSWGNVGTSSAGNHNHSFTTANSGSGTPHNNIQPSVVVYMWRRTG